MKKNNSVSDESAFGALIYGKGIESNKNYFVKPYAKYKKNDSTIVIYGETLKHKALILNPIP